MIMRVIISHFIFVCAWKEERQFYWQITLYGKQVFPNSCGKKCLAIKQIPGAVYFEKEQAVLNVQAVLNFSC